MKIAMLSPIAWRTPPRHYGPWESVVSILTGGLVKKGIDVTLFATKDSVTEGRLHAVCEKGYEEDNSINPKVWECLHISEVFEAADEFDLIHNHFDFLPLTYSSLVNTPLITTIHGFSSPSILPVYKKYNGKVHYISISDADRSPELDYLATIHHGIDINQFVFNESAGDYLLFFSRIHHDKGAKEAIEIAQAANKKLILAGIIQDKEYYKNYVEPHIDNQSIIYRGSVGHMERNELLGNALALLHPINFNEPFGLSVVEAMACGTPVIASKRGSMPELITHGLNGFLADNIDEAVKAVKNIEQIDRKTCRKTVEDRFTSERMTDDYINAYTTVLEKAFNKSVETIKNTIHKNRKYSAVNAADCLLDNSQYVCDESENIRPWGRYKIIAETADYKITGVADEWILQPEDPWELFGYVHNVVFTCGAVPEHDGTVKIYWGGADTVMCAGTANINDIVDMCRKSQRPAF